MTAVATTFRLLANIDNESATAILISALDSSSREARDEALGAILERKSYAAELALLRRWPDVSERWKQTIADRPGSLSRAIRAAIVNRERSLFEIACAAAVLTRDYETVPYLVAAAVDPANALASNAATATLDLAEQLVDELSSPRDYRSRRDPQLQRVHSLAALEQTIEHPTCAQVKTLLEAMLLLANRESASLLSILQTTTNPEHRAVIDILHSSTRPAIESLLLSFLDKLLTPHAALEIIAGRADLGFIRRLTRKLSGGPTAVEKANLQRINSIPWLRDNLGLLDGLHDNEQTGAIHLVVESAIPLEQALDVLAYLARHGKLAARRLAAQSLAQFRGPIAAKLTIELMNDDDPHVRAAAARQLRDRNIPGAIQRLAQLLDSSYPAEREAAASCLKEFTFDHFAATFDQLSAAARLESGALVRRVDPHAVQRIGDELTTGSRGRKKRAIELALALGAIENLHGQIASLLSDDDHYLRIEAIRALATWDSRATRDVLRDALLDPQPLVRETAEAALAVLTHRDTVKLTADPRRDTVQMATPQPNSAAAPPVAYSDSSVSAASEVLR